MAMITKRIKSSMRGLTFSLDGFGEFKPGNRYRYILDKGNNKLLILPVSDGDEGLVISRKKVANKIKSLFDLRNKEILAIMKNACFMEVEIYENEIIVSAHEKVEDKAVAEEKCVSIEQYMRHTVSYRIPQTVLKAAGEGVYYQYSLQDVFGPLYGMDEKQCDYVQNCVKKDLPHVLKVISIFSGAGMLDLPFAKDKCFEIVYAAEINLDAIKTYRNNIGNHMYQWDIRSLKGRDMPGADILIGGPPCQPYSNANPSKEKRGLGHEEGDMLMEYVRLVKETNVKLFVIENVPQFLTTSYGENLKYVLAELPEYEMSMKTVVDSDVGGYTTRKRAIIIGSKVGKIHIPDLAVRPVKSAGNAIEKVNESWRNYRDVSIPSEVTKYRISLVPEGGNWKDLPEEWQTKGIHSNMYRRLDRNSPSCAICNWRKYLLSPPRYDSSGAWDRILTVAEAAALSGLDETFEFLGKLSSMQQQVGNGVTYAMGTFVKNIVKKAFSGLRNEKNEIQLNEKNAIIELA